MSRVGVTVKKRLTLFQIVDEFIDFDGFKVGSTDERRCGFTAECGFDVWLDNPRGSAGRRLTDGRMSASNDTLRESGNALGAGAPPQDASKERKFWSHSVRIRHSVERCLRRRSAVDQAVSGDATSAFWKYCSGESSGGTSSADPTH
jgi:hypothetical protein